MIRIVMGPPCGGKSTYVSERAEKGDLIIDYDLIAKALGAPISHAADGIIKQAAFDARESAILRALDAPKENSWIIHTSPTKEHIERYEAVGAEFVELDPGRETCLERAKTDERPQQTFDGIEKYYAEKKGKTEMLYKTINLKVDDAGKVSGYFSTYDEEPDSYGDIVAPGAFTETIEKRKETGHPFPLCFNHNFDAVIGTIDTIEDTDKGPLITASFLNTEKAQEVREMVKSGAVWQFSFAYDIVEAKSPTDEQKSKGIEQVLTKLNLYEVSVVVVPANQNAVMTDVKAGKRNRKSDEDIIKEIIRLASSLLDDDTDETPEETEEPKEGQKANEDATSEELDALNARKDALLDFINKNKGDKKNEP